MQDEHFPLTFFSLSPKPETLKKIIRVITPCWDLEYDTWQRDKTCSKKGCSDYD